MKTTENGIFENLKRMTGDETLDNLKRTGEYYSINGASDEVNDIVNHMIVAVRNNADDEINELKKQIADKDAYIEKLNATAIEVQVRVGKLSREVEELSEMLFG